MNAPSDRKNLTSHQGEQGADGTRPTLDGSNPQARRLKDSVQSAGGGSCCGFCHGRPVGNAASWLDGKPRSPLPCPRCGEMNYPAPILCLECRQPVENLRCERCAA